MGPKPNTSAIAALGWQAPAASRRGVKRVCSNQQQQRVLRGGQETVSSGDDSWASGGGPDDVRTGMFKFPSAICVWCRAWSRGSSAASSAQGACKFRSSLCSKGWSPSYQGLSDLSSAPAGAVPAAASSCGNTSCKDCSLSSPSSCNVRRTMCARTGVLAAAGGCVRARADVLSNSTGGKSAGLGETLPGLPCLYKTCSHEPPRYARFARHAHCAR